MKYSALFIQDDSFIEKCLLLVKHIINPESKSLPHITVRVISNKDYRLGLIDELQQETVDHIDVICPDSFNLNTNGPYVVYLRCESSTLEENNYKPDFPYSRLHLTLYEGNNINFAKSLKQILDNYRWHYTISFAKPRALSVQTVGVKQKSFIQYDQLFEQILGKVPDNEWKENDDKKLQLINSVLAKQEIYLLENKSIEKTPSLNEKDIAPNKDGVMQVIKDYNNPVIEQYLPEKEDDTIVYVTPPEYANDMARCAIDAIRGYISEIEFGDSSIGTGSLFIALDRLINIENKLGDNNYRIKSAIGVDIDIKTATEAYRRCYRRGLQVIWGDAISDIDIGSQRNLMIVNPPYDRYQNIDTEYREEARALAKKITGISVSRLAGLYVYHLLIMDKWLSEEGTGVWLLPSSFLYTEYGYAVREYLINNVQLLRIHIYDENRTQFANAMVSTTIIVFRKNAPKKDKAVHVTVGETIGEAKLNFDVSFQQLFDYIDNWQELLLQIKSNGFSENYQGLHEKKALFRDLFDIKRGLATGANSFFVMSKEKSLEIGIPEIALKPILPKARYVESTVIEADENGNPLVNPRLVLLDCDLKESVIHEKYPKFYDYLQTAKEGEIGKRIVDRALVRKRNPWYKQEHREPPLFLLTYMGRQKEGTSPLYFLMNKSKAVALNTYILLYPKQWLLDIVASDETICNQLLIALNNSAQKTIKRQTRIYSGGLQKLEPNELKNIEIVGLPDRIITMLDSI